MMNKKAQTGGLISGLVFGVAGLIIGVIIAFVIVSTLTTSDLIAADAANGINTSVTDLKANFTSGIDNVSAKIPTVLLVAAIVLILGVMVLLVAAWRRMQIGGGNI